MLYRTSVAFMLSLLMVFTISCGGGEADQDATQSAAKKPAFPTMIEDIVAPGASLEKITGDMTFDNTNSPCWDDGVFYFTNNIFDPKEGSRTYRMEPDGSFVTIQVDNGVVAAISPSGSGTYYVCEMVGHRVAEIDGDGNVIRTVAGEYNGVRLDGPNDIVVDAKGGIYFTDSRFSPGSDLMQDTPAVYYVTPAGEVVRIIDDVNFPNGLDLSPDGKTLYVINTNGPDKGQFVFAWDVNADGTVSNKRNFCELKLTDANTENPRGSSGADGCTVDSMGNLYVGTSQGLGVQIFSAAGQYIGAISPDVSVNNCAFGGDDLKTLFVTGKDGVYKIQMQVAGIRLPLGS